MKKALSILLSLLLIYGSVTPSLAQGLAAGGKAAVRTVLTPVKLNRIARVTRLTVSPLPLSLRLLPARFRAPQLTEGLLAQKVEKGVSFNPNESIDITNLPFTEQDVRETLDNLRGDFSPNQSASYLNAFPHFNISRGFAVSAEDRALAISIYRRELAVAQQHPAETTNMWARHMAVISNIGFYGTPTDAYAIVNTCKAIPSQFAVYTDVIASRALLSLGAYDQLQELAAFRAVDGTLPAHWQGTAQYVKDHNLSVELPAVQEGTVPALSAAEKESLQKWNLLNTYHADVSAEATENWLALRSGADAYIMSEAAETALEEAAARPTIQNGLNIETAAPTPDELAIGATDLPPAAAADEAAANGAANAAAPANIPVTIQIRAGSTISDAALTKALNLSSAGAPSKGFWARLTGQNSNKKLIKKIHNTLELARNKADTEFITLSQQAQKEGRYLTSEDYNNLLSEKFSAAVAADPALAPYARDIAAAVSDPAATAPAAAKRELSYSLKIQDADGKVLPITLDLNIRLLDNTAIKQFERLGVSNSEIFTLMRATKDGKPTGPFELMLTTPGGSKRPIYEPFIEGGKAGVEALYYRVLGDYQAGKLAQGSRVDLNLYSDVFAERATMFAGFTEGLGGLPQATVAPQSTALGISNPKDLQAGVSHSQLGNVASVIFSGLQKQLGIKNTLALGLGIATLGLSICGFGLSLPTLPAKIAMLGLGSFVLGVGANGGVKSTNSIFAKEISNDNMSGTARMGFVNARASLGTMTGYLFFPVSVLFAVSGVQAFQWLYYGATAVPAYALANLWLSKAKNIGADLGATSTFVQKAKAVGKSILGIGKNIVNNIKFALSGGYKERLEAIRERRIAKTNAKQYGKVVDQTLNGQGTSEVVSPGASSTSLWAKIKDFTSVKLPAATSQYMLRMMALVGLYHFAGMMYNSGPGAIIGNFIKSPEGAAIVNWAQNMPMPITALLAGGAGYLLTKLGQLAFNTLKKKFTRGPVENSVENPTTIMEKASAFTKKNLPWLVGGATTAATAAFPKIYEMASSIFSRFDPTSVAQIATFFTAYVGVWAGRQYLSGFVKSGKLTPQGIIGASGVLSTLAVSAAFLPMPLGAKAVLWGIAGLGFANLAGFENSLAMEKYPNQKPAVNMAYTLARLSGAATVLYGSLANSFAANCVPDPEINALVLPAGALALATFINRKYFTQNFFQDVRRWRGLPPTLNSKLLRTEADVFYKKYLQSNHSVATMSQDAQRIATKLFQETRHELTTVERLMKPLNEKLRLNELRIKVIDELKTLLNGAAQNQVPLGVEELTYKTLRNREIQPLLSSLSGRTLSAEEEAQVIRSAAALIYNRYFIKAADLDAMRTGIVDRNEGLDMFRLEVLRDMYKMELTKIATDRAERYQGNRPSYDRAMAELRSMADKVLGPNHGWEPPAFK